MAAPLSIKTGFPGCGFSGRDDSDHVVSSSITVANNQKPELFAESQNDKPIFVFSVIWVVDQLGVLVTKNRFGFLEANTMLPDIGRGLLVIPLKMKFAHKASVVTL
jgi:hypothetical protein